MNATTPTADESLPRCESLDGSTLRVVPAFTGAGRYCETYRVTLTDGVRTAVYVPHAAPPPETLPRCEKLDGSTLSVFPAYTEGGRLCEARCVTLTDGVRAALYVPVPARSSPSQSGPTQSDPPQPGPSGGGVFRRRPQTIRAQRWRPGLAVTVARLTEVPTAIHYSLDRKQYYVTRPGCRPTCWLSVGVAPSTPHSVHPDGSNVIAPGTTTYRPDGAPSYQRGNWPFAFWKVQDGAVEPLDEASRLYQDYALVCGWPAARTHEARLDPLGVEGRTRVLEGDWVVAADGVVTVLADAEFHALYEPA